MSASDLLSGLEAREVPGEEDAKGHVPAQPVCAWDQAFVLRDPPIVVRPNPRLQRTGMASSTSGLHEGAWQGSDNPAFCDCSVVSVYLFKRFLSDLMYVFA
jgi:hypothetical protein